MKTIIIILTIVAVIVTIPLIIALFVRKGYTVKREIVINKPTSQVFSYVKLLKNQDYYNKWVMTDPNMKKDFRGTDSTIGFAYAWDSVSKNAGKGEQEITGISEGNTIDVEIRFEKPFAGIAHTQMITQSLSDQQTKVVWGMTGESKYPMNLMNLFIDGLLGKDLQRSLTNLKDILEKK